MATHSSILAWKIPDRGTWQVLVHRVAKSQTQENAHNNDWFFKKSTITNKFTLGV